MEQLISEIEGYCLVAGIRPQKLLRDAIDASWRQWDAWKAGKSSPTQRTVDRLRAHMADHPPHLRDGREQDAA